MPAGRHGAYGGNPTTAIKYNIPEEGNLRITVYNSLGKEIGILVKNKLQKLFLFIEAILQDRLFFVVKVWFV